MEVTNPAQFVDYFGKVRARTERVVERIPREHLNWTIQAGRFTLGDIVRHLAAIERWMYAENAVCRPSRYPGHGPELAANYDEVMAYFGEMHRQSLAIFASLTPDDLVRKCETPAGIRITVGKWLRAMVEHEVHHRGQLYVYLGVLGVPVPQIFGLTSERVREVSVQDDAPN